MRIPTILEELRAARDRADAGCGRRAVLDRLADVITELERQAGADETPERTREKLARLLQHVEWAHDTLGSRMFHVAFALNVLGEGMARANLVHKSVVEFVQIGLYFFGLEQIERRWSSRATVYSGVHADHLGEFLSRRALKDLLAAARVRMDEGRIFCLTYAYLNSLRKAYWKHCRASEDALDVAITAETVSEKQAEALPAPEASDPSDRVALMLDIFDKKLTSRQRWIYLAKNRSSLFEGRDSGEGIDGDLLALLLGDAGPPGADRGWAESARRLDVNEKTAKREYLRSLHVLLKESSEAVFGRARIPSNYVRRILEQIRDIVYEKDLRIRSATGRGMGTLVEKWEVALRFVLNHDRVVA